MEEVVRPWRGVSADDRRAQRRAQLIDACLDVAGETGVEAATIDAIVKQAGLSKRYFYESFANRDEVLVATFDELMAGIRVRLDEALASATSPNDRVSRTVAALTRALSEDARAARVFTEAGRSAALEQSRQRAFDEFTALLVEGIFDSSPDPRLHATALLIVAGTTEVLARWLGGQIALSEAEVSGVISGIGRRLRTGEE